MRESPLRRDLAADYVPPRPQTSLFDGLLAGDDEDDEDDEMMTMRAIRCDVQGSPITVTYSRSVGQAKFGNVFRRLRSVVPQDPRHIPSRDLEGAPGKYTQYATVFPKS